jgi:hypothetical protein
MLHRLVLAVFTLSLIIEESVLGTTEPLIGIQRLELMRTMANAKEDPRTGES